MNRILQNSKCCLWLIALIGIMQSCTKTEYTDYEKEPTNRILEYRVTNSQQELLGAIDNAHNTITVYIPYYLGLEYLNAEIKLEEGAKLLDSTGAEINLDGGLAPVRVSPDSVTVNYTVVPETGNKRTYTLIQKILPYPHALEATYVGMDAEATQFTMGVNFYMDIVGNFESTTTNMKILLTDKVTGAVHGDWIRPVSMTAGNNAAYTLNTLISAEALAGEYKVQIAHQGRITSLPDLKLVYTRSRGSSYPGFTASTGNYAPGDTVVMTAEPVYSINSGYDGGIFLPVDRVYIKILKTYPGRAATPVFTVPDAFPEELFGQEIELELISQSRTELKFIFPDLPAGLYKNNRSGGYARYEREDGRERLEMTNTNFGIYVDWAASTGWGKGFLSAWTSTLQFTVNSK